MSSPTPTFRVPNIPAGHLAVLTRVQRYTRQIYNSRHSILQYHKYSDRLTRWEWPIDAAGHRVIPMALLSHCLSNNLPRPYCLCPLKCPNKPAFMEAIFLLMNEGAHSGEYVAKCAEDCCGYFAPIERVYKYARTYQFVTRYAEDPTTGAGSSGMSAVATMVGVPTDTRLSPTPIHDAPAITLRPGNRLKRSYAHLNLNDTFAIPVFQPSSRRASETEILLKLNDYTQPGLYEEEFMALLGRMVKCPCGMIMVQRVFKEHRCKLSMLMRPLKRRRIDGGREIVDLTLD